MESFFSARKKNQKKFCKMQNWGFFGRDRSGFAKKVQKSDFPTKLSHFQKKSFQFVTIKKKFFFAKLFLGFQFWTFIFVHFQDPQKSFGNMDFMYFGCWILDFRQSFYLFNA